METKFRMLENIVGKRYAEALANSISDDAGLSKALEGLGSFCETFRTEPKLKNFFAHPSIPQKNKAGMVEELCDRFQVEKVVRNLVQLLAERKKILFLEPIRKYFEKVVDARLGRARVSVASARELNSEQDAKLRESLGRIFKKDILLETHVDESLIGGMVLQIEGLVLDGSIKNRLALLKQAIEKEEVV